MTHTAENDALPVGPIVDDACARYGDCKRPRAAHRETFMDLRDGVIDHDFEEPAPRPYDHERVAAMITTEWHCHLCGRHNDVWGTGATEGYMQCGSCGALSWLDFNPDGFEAAESASVIPPDESAADERDPMPCPRCGEICTYDGWGHVHTNGLGIGSCATPVKPAPHE